ncbi:MAG: hypothetical protein ACR2QF_01280 [Geminicoccaceae bacterium]
MPWEKGKSGHPGGSPSLARRKWKATVEAALNGDGEYTIEQLVEREINIAMNSEDETVALKALKGIRETIDGKVVAQKEEGGDALLLSQLKVLMMGMMARTGPVPVNGSMKGAEPFTMIPADDDDHSNGHDA